MTVFRVDHRVTFGDLVTLVTDYVMGHSVPSTYTEGIDPEAAAMISELTVSSVERIVRTELTHRGGDAIGFPNYESYASWDNLRDAVAARLNELWKGTITS
jgi:hypothetical protein